MVIRQFPVFLRVAGLRIRIGTDSPRYDRYDEYCRETEGRHPSRRLIVSLEYSALVLRADYNHFRMQFRFVHGCLKSTAPARIFPLSGHKLRPS